MFPPTSIHSLPVELLARIFILGAGFEYPYGSSPFLLKPSEDYYAPPSSNFALLVSATCSHWRSIALRTPDLWTVLHFRELAHIPRARAFLKRAHQPHALFDILVDTVAPHEHIPGVTLSHVEIGTIFELITPHVHRWRAFHLKVRDNDCKIAARQYLSTCGAAPNLKTLQLYHFEDYRTVQNLYFATFRPPVMVFNNILPALRNVSLIGVNLPWAQSPYLAFLHTLELALHSDNIRPPYQYWRSMLSSPQLHTLTIHYSGPKAADAPWSSPTADDSVIPVPTLRVLSLTDLDPDYLCRLMDRLHLPAISHLSLNLPDQDSTPFLDMLCPSTATPRSASPPPDPASPTASSTSTAFVTPSPTIPSAPPPHIPFPHLPAHLHTLVINALECTLPAWLHLIRTLRSLRVFEVDFDRMGNGAPVFSEVFCPARGVEHEKSNIEGKVEVLLPNLEVFKVAGVSGDRLALMIAHREAQRAQETGTTKGDGGGAKNGHSMDIDTTKRSGFWLHTDTDESDGESDARTAVDDEGVAAPLRALRWVVRWSPRYRGRDVALDALVEGGWPLYCTESDAQVKVEWVEKEGEELEEEGDDDEEGGEEEEGNENENENEEAEAQEDQEDGEEEEEEEEEEV